MESISFRPGQRLGPYVLEARMGGDLSSDVWRARHSVLEDRVVAIRVPHDLALGGSWEPEEVHRPFDPVPTEFDELSGDASLGRWERGRVPEEWIRVALTAALYFAAGIPIAAVLLAGI